MNTNKKTNRKYNKPVPVSFIKSFDSFEEGFGELLKLNPELKNYCGDSLEYENVVSSILKILLMDIPSLNNTSYPNTLSLSIDANEMGFKTDSNIALGWRTGFNYKSGVQFFNFRISYFSLPSYKKGIYKEMEESGWKRIVKEERQTRFWNKLEGKDLKNSISTSTRMNKISTTKRPFENTIIPPTAEYIEDTTVLQEEVKKETVVKEDTTTLDEPLFDSEDLDKEVIEEESTIVEEENVVEKETTVKEENEVEETNNVVEEETKQQSNYPAGYPQTVEEAMDNFLATREITANTKPVDMTWEDPKTGKTVLIKYEKILEYKMRNDNSIFKGTLDNKYVITCHGMTYMVDISDETSISKIGATLDLSNKTITKDDITFNYETLTVLS